MLAPGVLSGLSKTSSEVLPGGVVKKTPSREIWSKDEDERIRIFGDANGLEASWRDLCLILTNHTEEELKKRYGKILKMTNSKTQWTREEDDLLVAAIGKHGPKNWSNVAQEVPGRNGKQCRERWCNYLDPDIKRDAWQREEDRLILKYIRTTGSRWAEMAKALPGRYE